MWFGLGNIELPVQQIQKSLLLIEGIQNVTQIPLETRYANNKSSMTEFRFELLTDRDCRSSIFHFALKHDLLLLECSSNQSDLEDVFRQLTQSPSE